MASDRRASKRVRIWKSKPALEAPQPGSWEDRLKTLNSLPLEKVKQILIPPEYMTFSPAKQPDAAFHLDFYAAAELPVDDYWRCYALLKETSKDDYKLSTRGWHPDHKKREMKEKNMRYFILRREQTSGDRSEAGGDHVEPEEYAFLSYQLDDDETSTPDERIPVLYIYEIHLTESLRALGLGRHLMKLAELIAAKAAMEKLELSVFRRNANAESFYRSLGYETDETSPQPRRIRGRTIEPDWLVLSKPVTRKPEYQDSGD
jgi:ribosomal protein S18 acetylase RimI-like enzyme